MRNFNRDPWGNRPRGFFGQFGCFGYIVAGMMTVMAILFVAGMVWNYKLYQDCLADGNKAYQCKAMLSESHYVAVDVMEGQ
jgi:hypothetical protein